jgi:hypothetical protein
MHTVMMWAYMYRAVRKAPTDTELTNTREPVATVVYESIEERRSQPVEVLTESPLYQSRLIVQTNPAYGVQT